jgi:peptidoglycan/xylan/chitin deacetylase (PgdA/CDA1 family)
MNAIARKLWLTGALLALALAARAEKPFEWPNGARYAVSLTYDDALESGRLNAVPALDKAGFKGTFFLSGPVMQSPDKLKLWAAVGKEGHELASHTLFHPCAASIKIGMPGYALEDYDLPRMEKELRESQARLVALGIRPAGETFAYPCGQDWVGRDRVSYRPLVDKIFFAARGVQGGVADPWSVDLGMVPSIGNSPTGDGMRYWAEQAEQSGGWAVFLFHGVGGDYLTTKLEAHQALIDYLKTAEGLVWVAPFGEVAQWIKKHR